ncbi:MAG: sulfurtransferase TusA family protein [Deltaproteobacteria bacterium]|nr:sulfurtransferase TusA family protein [Deltaproteobacteria bacterium]
MKNDPDYILDLRGAIPPITLLKISQVFREMKTEEIIEILCGDPDTRSDIFKVLPKFSYDMIMMEKMEEESASYRVRMRKKTNF